MLIVRVVVIRDSDLFIAEAVFVAIALEQDMVDQGPNAFEAVSNLGLSFDARDAIPDARELPGAPQEYAKLWDAGVDLGVVELGAKRRAHVRMALSR